jgi:hypothetical protein
MPYIHFDAYKFVLENLRQHYPDSDVFIYFDSFREDAEKYKHVALEYNCNFILCDNTVFYTDVNDSFDVNSKKMIEIYDRISNTCNNSKSDWILIVEDDVYIKKQIEKFPNADVGTSRYYFRPGGGSIFKRNRIRTGFSQPAHFLRGRDVRHQFFLPPCTKGRRRKQIFLKVRKFQVDDLSSQKPPANQN